MLEITGLQKTFLKGTPNEHHALQGLNLTLPDGQFVTIIGSNGAGKSTLFNAIAGSFSCDAGQIVLDGRNITRMPEYRRARTISRIFQNPLMGTAPNLTIEENLALSYARSTKKLFSRAVTRKDTDYFRSLLAPLGMGLEDRMKTRIGLLSGGQRQAVTLLMCTMVPPRLLLLDEHTAALDPVTAEKILKLTAKIVAEHQITTMMITHNIKDALQLGDRTIMLEQGRIVLDLSGEQRTQMDVAGLLQLYRRESGKELDNDRMLLTGE